MANTVLDSLAGPSPSWQPDADPAGADLNQPVIGDTLEASSPTELSAELRSIKGNTRVLSLDPAWVNFEGCDDTRFCPSAARAVKQAANRFTLTDDWTTALGSGRPAIAQLGRKVRVTLDNGARDTAIVALAPIFNGLDTLVTLDKDVSPAGTNIKSLEWGLLVPDESPSWLGFDTIPLGPVAGIAAAPSFGGSGYAVGDILTVLNARSPTDQATVVVASVTAGVVTSLSLGVHGQKYAVGSQQATVAVTGTGTGCTVEVTSIETPTATAFVVPVSQGGTGRVDTAGGPVDATLLQHTPIAATIPTALDVLGVTAPQAIVGIVVTPGAGGSSYGVNDTLRILAGDGTATVRVTAVDGFGAITALALTFAGSGYGVATSQATATQTGLGVGATVDVTAVSAGSVWQATALALLLQVPQIVAANPGAFTVSTLGAGAKLLVRFGSTNGVAIPAGTIAAASIAWSGSPAFASGSFWVAVATATESGVVATISGVGQTIETGLQLNLRNTNTFAVSGCSAFVVAVGLAA